MEAPAIVIALFANLAFVTPLSLIRIALAALPLYVVPVLYSIVLSSTDKPFKLEPNDTPLIVLVANLAFVIVPAN